MKNNKQQIIINKIKNILSSDNRIKLAFVTGSAANDELTELSDIDLWIITKEENDLNKIVADISLLFQNKIKIKHIYRSTEHHYFVILKNQIQIDLNIASSALFYSLTQNKNKKIIYDPHFCSITKNKKEIKKNCQTINNLLVIGYTTLARTTSKYFKNNFFVVVRFIDNIRNNIIIPLIPFTETEKMPNPITLDVNNLSHYTKKEFLKTFPKPIKKDCYQAILSTLNLLDRFNNSSNKDIFLTNLSKKIKKVLKSTNLCK